MSKLLLPKYCSLKNSDGLDLTRNQPKWHWESSICISTKFPFDLTDNKELFRGNFNSNFNFKCLITSECKAQDSKYLFQYEINYSGTDKAFSNLIDKNNSLLRISFIQSNFKFYQNHEFSQTSKGIVRK